MAKLNIVDGLLIVTEGSKILYGHGSPRPRHFRKAQRLVEQYAPETYRVEFITKGGKPIQSIKGLREATGMSLVDAKTLVDRGTILAEGVSRDVAVRVEAAMTAAGNVVKVTQITGGRK